MGEETNRVVSIEELFASEKIDNADFSQCGVLGGLPFSGRALAGCLFDGAAASGADFTGCRRERCSFRGANLSDAAFEEAALTDCDLAGANLANAQFVRAKLARV